MGAQHVELGARHVGGNGVDIDDHPPLLPPVDDDNRADLPTEMPPDPLKFLGALYKQ